MKYRTDPTKMASSKSVIPYGFKTLVETLGKTVLFEQPADIRHFASIYFKELLEFRAVNPTLDLKELVNLFYVSKVITTGPDERSEWLSDPEEPADQNVTASSNKCVPINQKAAPGLLIKNASLEYQEDVSVLHEDFMPRLFVTETSFNKSNMVSKKEISEMYKKEISELSKKEISEVATEDKPSFVYIYTNTCSVNQDESGFAYIYTDASSVNQEDKSTNFEHEPAHLEVTNMTKKPAPVLEQVNKSNSIPVLGQVQRAQVDSGTVKQVSVHKSQPSSRKSQSVSETSSAYRALSSDSIMYQKAISVAHKAVPVHAEAVPVYTEQTPVLCSEMSALDNYKELLITLGRVSIPVEAASADRELGKNVSLVHFVDTTPGDHKNLLEKCNSHECSSVLKAGKARRETIEKTLESLLYTKKADVHEKDTNKMESKKEPGVIEAVNEIQETESLSTPSQTEKVISEHNSDSEIEGSSPLAYQGYSHHPDSLLDLQRLHSESQQESLNVMSEIFEKVYNRLGELEFHVQDLVNRLQDLSTTVNEIHSAMNISILGDSFCSNTFERHENFIHS